MFRNILAILFILKLVKRTKFNAPKMKMKIKNNNKSLNDFVLFNI